MQARSNISTLSGAELPEFGIGELQAMNRYCLKYRDLVRGGGTPTNEQDGRFMRYQRVTYATGVAHGF